MNAHELRLGETVFDGLHGHKCHDRAHPFGMQSHIVLYTLHVQEFIEVYSNQTMFALDEEEILQKDALLLGCIFCP